MTAAAVNPLRQAIEIASWNVNSIRARLEHVRWLAARNPDILLLQELKGTEFPCNFFKDLGYELVAVTQKAYNGVAIYSRQPIQLLSSFLPGDEADSHARFLEVMIGGFRIVNIYRPGGNPVGTAKFAYKLAWMDRLALQIKSWLQTGVPTIIGATSTSPRGHRLPQPASWIHDALFQPESRARYRAMLGLGYTDVFRSLHPGVTGQFTFWDYFRQAFEHNRGIRIDHFLITPDLADRVQACEIDKAPRAFEKPSDHTPVVLQLRS